MAGDGRRDRAGEPWEGDRQAEQFPEGHGRQRRQLLAERRQLRVPLEGAGAADGRAGQGLQGFLRRTRWSEGRAGRHRGIPCPRDHRHPRKRRDEAGRLAEGKRDGDGRDQERHGRPATRHGLLLRPAGDHRRMGRGPHHEGFGVPFVVRHLPEDHRRRGRRRERRAEVRGLAVQGCHRRDQGLPGRRREGPRQRREGVRRGDEDRRLVQIELRGGRSHRRRPHSRRRKQEEEGEGHREGRREGHGRGRG